jgi:Holliday junction resolvasome RuvABC DNA-binding subunit
MAQGDGSQLMRDAVSALVNLGYRRPEAEKNVREITQRGERPLPEVLKEALRRLSQ